MSVLVCCVLLNIFISNILYNTLFKTRPPTQYTSLSINMLHPPAPGMACDGCGIAKDDLREIEQAQKRDEIICELFHNTAHIHTAMQANGLLRPIFRKYKQACRRILQQKKDEANQLLHLYEYCDSCNTNNKSNHDLRIIKAEVREIHDQIKRLEDLQWDTDSYSGADDADDADEEEEEEEEEEDDDDDEEK